MNKDEIEAIAQRPTCCKAWGEAVTLSRAERDALVAMARDGANAPTLVAALRLAENEMRYAGWFEPQSDNAGQEPAYAAVVAALADTSAKER
ncbi:hypothetical protein ELS24_10335 [Achromobacter spanius]|uniref:hypothetical protein n=1 Tax=Achromobacter spanius TaxID=217203 RepID=UPI000F8FA8B1|nr:hypothetical protein [Achromobacter spanius]AZS78806.1 hypothetical protein ELS24_10335 [Achromobacter spanius]